MVKVPATQLGSYVTVIAELRRECDELRALMREVYDELEEGDDAPGHCHRIPGVWDMDNRKDLRGKPCEWCATWKRFRAAMSAQEPPDTASPPPPAAERTG